jgi:hypothetical protein
MEHAAILLARESDSLFNLVQRNVTHDREREIDPPIYNPIRLREEKP